MPPNQSSLPLKQSEHRKSTKKRKQEPSRFLPCPVCQKSFPSYFIHDHANICLDSPARSRPAPSPSTTFPPSSCSSQKLPLISDCHDPFRISRSAVSAAIGLKLDAKRSFGFEDPLTAPTCEKPSSTDQNSQEIMSLDSPLTNFTEVPVFQRLSKESDDARIRTLLHEECSSHHLSQDLHQTNILLACASIQSREATGLIGPDFHEEEEDICGSSLAGKSLEEIQTVEQDDMASLSGFVSDKPGLGLQIFQMQRQSQAKLSMLCKFPISDVLQRRPAITVLQSGMVLLRSWLSLDIQQRLVNESQITAHLFKRPTTAGGGKYHLYSWDAKTRRYAAEVKGQRLPSWMYNLAKELASEAHGHTRVYVPRAEFAPDVGLVNFYPVKDGELGVVGLGGHQDLDDYCDMPVVSVSVGDSMTFFYRRLPPLSRRKSGVQIIVDESSARDCKDGDTAHNSEKKIVLESGDVLVFGGDSRLVYHGTRNVQPGTRPPGLHMVPGRLNFTFRQCNAAII